MTFQGEQGRSRDQAHFARQVRSKDQVRSHMHEPSPPRADGCLMGKRLRHLGKAGGRDARPTQGWHAGCQAGRQGAAARCRTNPEAADGQPRLTRRELAQRRSVRIGRPTKSARPGGSCQQPQPALGRPKRLRHRRPRASRQAVGDARHSRVTPGRCPTSWPSTYSAPSGAPASA